MRRKSQSCTAKGEKATSAPSSTPALVCAVVHVAPISFKLVTMSFKSFFACAFRAASSFSSLLIPSSTAEMARTVPALKAALRREETSERVQRREREVSNVLLHSGSGPRQAGTASKELDEPDDVGRRREALVRAYVGRWVRGVTAEETATKTRESVSAGGRRVKGDIRSVKGDEEHVEGELEDEDVRVRSFGGVGTARSKVRR